MSKLKKWWNKFISKFTGSNKTSKPVERVAAWQYDTENAFENGWRPSRSGESKYDYLDRSALSTMENRDDVISRDHAINKVSGMLRLVKLLDNVDSIPSYSGDDTSASVEVGPFNGEYEDGTTFQGYTGGTVDLTQNAPLSDLASDVLPAGAAVGTSQSVQNAVPATNFTTDLANTAMSAQTSSKGNVFGNLLAGIGAAVGSGLFDWFNYRRQRRDYLEDREHAEEREDSAVQRLIQDKIAAGLSPYADVNGGSSSNSAPMQPYNSNDVFRDMLDTAMSVQDFRESQENLDSISLANMQARQDLSTFNIKLVSMMQDLAAKKVDIERMKEDLRSRHYDNEVLKPLYAAEKQVDIGISRLERDSYQTRLDNDLKTPEEKHYDYLVRHFGKENADKWARRDASGSFGRAVSTIGTVGGLALGAGSLISKFRKSPAGAAASVLSAPLNISNKFYNPSYSNSY